MTCKFESNNERFFKIEKKTEPAYTSLSKHFFGFEQKKEPPIKHEPVNIARLPNESDIRRQFQRNKRKRPAKWDKSTKSK